MATMTVSYLTVDGEILSETRSGTESDYIPDPLGSTADLLNSSQTITDTFTWWPYGELRNHGTGSSATAFGYIGTLGYYSGGTSGRTYVRANVLRPWLTRWQSLDHLWPIQQGFAYISSSPVTYVDPAGLSPQRKPKPKPVNHIQLASLCASAGVLQSACDGLDLDKVYQMLMCVIEAEVADPGSMYWGPNVMKSDGGYPYNPNVPDRNIGPCRMDLNLVNDTQDYFRRHPPHGKPYNGIDPDWYKTPCDNIVEGAIALCSQIKQRNGAGDYSFPWGRWLRSDENRYNACMSMTSKMPPRFIFG